MTLKERLYEESKHWHIKEELDEFRKNKTEGYKMCETFDDICDHLGKTMDLSDIYFPDYASVFDFIEKNNINISNMIKPYEYDYFKKKVLAEPVIMLPMIGKKPDKVYDLTNRDDYEEYWKKRKEKLRRKRINEKQSKSKQ